MKKPPPWIAPDPLPARLETARLVLRFWRHEDAPAMLEAIDVDRALLTRWMPWPGVDNRNLAECTYNIERFRRRSERQDGPPADYAIGIFDRTTGRVVGGTGFHRIDFENGQAEVGYWIRPDRHRQGLCTEAVAALLGWGFGPQPQGGWGFRRIVIECAEPNVASQGVPEKLGLRRELHARRHRWVDELGWVDTLGWGVDAEEWTALTASR
jgi:RimJ/RimL family protein N-acetyltransferase